ncbi:unnamed protein product [Chrysodeixis includens]|uniref:Alcohol dehydrogenase n=1 Tax=Chrysodeixis includens TaxID=689277 RepID=A0A9N8Q0W8_CHRIL|nr:unnamed protein product [Chrysodeixis includens]
MATDLTNKVVVVTGGADGIGYAIADKYLAQGAQITILLDINEQRGPEAAKKLTSKYGENKAVFIKCDLTTDLADVSKKIFDNYKVDVLVNNAGIYNENKLKLTIDVNVTAVIDWGLHFWQHMRKDKGGNGGTMINIASIYGFRVDQFMPIYQATKFAVMGFTRSLGHTANFMRSGVRVVAICPGYTKTKLEAIFSTNDLGQTEEFHEFLSTQLWQEAEAVGDAAVEVFQRATSGSAWLIEGAKPIVEIDH